MLFETITLTTFLLAKALFAKKTKTNFHLSYLSPVL